MTAFEKQQRETEEMIRKWYDEKPKMAGSAEWTFEDEVLALIDWRDATQHGATK